MDNINISMLIKCVMLYMDDDFNRLNFCIPIFIFIVSRIDPSSRKQTTQKINSIPRIYNIIYIRLIIKRENG